MPQITTARLRMNCERAGSGPRLLYISGTGSDLRARPGVFESPLAPAFDLLAYDQRGLGQTDKPPGPYSMRDYADDAAALLDVVGWERCRVMGVSFGGMVAQEFALRHPQRVERMVLACTSAGGAGSASYPLHELPDAPPEERARRSLHLGDTRMAAMERDHPARFQRFVDFIVQGYAIGEGRRGASAASGCSSRRAPATTCTTACRGCACPCWSAPAATTRSPRPRTRRRSRGRSRAPSWRCSKAATCSWCRTGRRTPA